MISNKCVLAHKYARVEFIITNPVQTKAHVTFTCTALWSLLSESSVSFVECVWLIDFVLFNLYLNINFNRAAITLEADNWRDTIDTVDTY